MVIGTVEEKIEQGRGMGSGRRGDGWDVKSSAQRGPPRLEKESPEGDEKGSCVEIQGKNTKVAAEQHVARLRNNRKTRAAGGVNDEKESKKGIDR